MKYPIYQIKKQNDVWLLLKKETAHSNYSFVAEQKITNRRAILSLFGQIPNTAGLSDVSFIIEVQNE